MARMTLQQKIGLTNLVSSLIFYALMALALYWVISTAVYRELDEHLLGHKNDIITKIEAGDIEIKRIMELGPMATYEWLQLIPVDELESQNLPKGNEFSNVETIPYPIKENGESDYYRVLKSKVSIKGKDYVVKIYEHIAGWRTIVITILSSILVMLLAWIILLYFINRELFKRILSPSYQTIERLRKIESPQQISTNFPGTYTKKLKILNH